MLSNRRIRQIADSGNRARLEKYIKENSRRANDRMRGIEKRRKSNRGYVYGIAQEKLRGMGRKRFGSRLDKLSIDQLEEQALSLNNYLRAKTSTYSGLVSRENKIIKSLVKRGYDIKNRELFFQILQSDLISDYAELDSDEVIQSASQWANADDASVLDAIKKAEEEYSRNNKLYIDDAFKLIEEYIE
jgi:hypothetical protein